MQEPDLSKLVESIEKNIAVSAQQFEPSIKRLVKQLMDPGNGKVIQIPGQKAYQVQGPKERHVLAAIAEAIGLLLQGQRFTMLAIRAIVKELPEPEKAEPDATSREEVVQGRTGVQDNHAGTPAPEGQDASVPTPKIQAGQ